MSPARRLHLLIALLVQASSSPGETTADDSYRHSKIVRMNGEMATQVIAKCQVLSTSCLHTFCVSFPSFIPRFIHLDACAIARHFGRQLIILESHQVKASFPRGRYFVSFLSQT